MNFTLTALLGLTLAQPPAPDYHPWNSRSINLPIVYKQSDRKNINQIQLFVSADKGQTWKLELSAFPTQNEFAYTAPKDGLYWFQMVIVDRQGKRDPANLTSEPPALKVLVDTQVPLVTITNVRRDGQDVIVEWRVDDDFPNDVATRIYFRPSNSAPDDWSPVSRPPGPRPAVKFPCGTTGPIVLKVVGVDLSGNTAESVKEIAGTNASSQLSTSLSPGTIAAPAVTPAISPASGQTILPPPSGVIPPPDLGMGAPMAPSTTPAIPAGPTPLMPSNSVLPLASPSSPSSNPPTNAFAPTAPVASSPLSAPTNSVGGTMTPVPMNQPIVSPTTAMMGSPSAMATFDPRNTAPPSNSAAQMNAVSPAAAGPLVEANRPQVISTLRFDLNYQVEQRGPSGISKVDLWVTRDDGRTWVWWSQHSGQEITAVKVNLATPSNTQPEGLYGFRLVPVSGAGLTDATPVAGDAPDMRVIVDITPPAVKVFPPSADPASNEGLVIQWEAVDRNFGDEPITLEWAESPSGPWRPIASAGVEPVLQAGLVAGSSAKKLPNAGRHAWRVPAGLPPRVYLKVTARDLAGNATEQVTRDPVLIDLTKPKARITGIGTLQVNRP